MYCYPSSPVPLSYPPSYVYLALIMMTSMSSRTSIPPPYHPTPSPHLEQRAPTAANSAPSPDSAMALTEPPAVTRRQADPSHPPPHPAVLLSGPPLLLVPLLGCRRSTLTSPCSAILTHTHTHTLSLSHTHTHTHALSLSSLETIFRPLSHTYVCACSAVATFDGQL